MQPGPIALQDWSSVASITAIKFVSAVLERGSYPFPFRTRQSSLPSPMVPGLRARESRAPLDSRGPSPKRRGASSFLQTVPPLCGYTLATTTRQYESLVAHCPLMVNLVGGFFYTLNVTLTMLSVLSMTLVRVSNSYPLWMEGRNSR